MLVHLCITLQPDLGHFLSDFLHASLLCPQERQIWDLMLILHLPLLPIFCPLKIDSNNHGHTTVFEISYIRVKVLAFLIVCLIQFSVAQLNMANIHTCSYINKIKKNLITELIFHC